MWKDKSILGVFLWPNIQNNHASSKRKVSLLRNALLYLKLLFSRCSHNNVGSEYFSRKYGITQQELNWHEITSYSTFHSAQCLFYGTIFSVETKFDLQTVWRCSAFTKGLRWQSLIKRHNKKTTAVKTSSTSLYVEFRFIISVLLTVRLQSLDLFRYFLMRIFHDFSKYSVKSFFLLLLWN